MAGYIVELARVNNGLAADDGSGTTLRSGADIINSNSDVIKVVVNSLASVDTVKKVGNGVLVDTGSGAMQLGGSDTVNGNSLALASAMNYLAISQAAGGQVSFLTKADMDADLSHDDGVIALVTNDPTPENNQAWRKSGASGAGAWSITIDRLSVVLGNGAGMQQAGSGVVRSFQDKIREISLSITDFDAPGGDYGVALQSAHDALPSTGGTIDIPAGTFVCATGVVLTKAVTIRGKNNASSVLNYTGSGIFLTQSTSQYLRFVDVGICGVGVTTGPICNAGSVAFKSAGVVESYSADFLFWETISVYNGGYYHKHSVSSFRYFRTGFSAYNQNNLSFQNCRVTTFQDFVTVAGGSGPIMFAGGSIENIAHIAFTSVSGGIPMVSIVGAYFENRPALACPSPIASTSGFFDNGIAVYCGDLPICIYGCNVQMTGFLRFVYSGGSVNGACVTSLGNTFYFNSATGYDYVYYMAGTAPTGLFMDVVGDTAPPAGKYMSAVSKAPGKIIYKDLTTGIVMNPSAPPSFSAVAPSNGWVGVSTGGFSPPAYAIRDGWVYLHGTVNGSAASSATILTLPTGARPPGYVQFAVCATTGTVYSCRVGANGDVLLDGITSGFPPNLGLDGIRFSLS